MKNNNNNSSIDNDVLLSQCENICQKVNIKSTIRVLHHFACSGGSLISKCISAMPNTFLLSEVHPTVNLHINSEKAKYLPSDISSLAKYARVPQQNKLAKQLFASSLKITNEHVNQLGGSLIIREHTHSDFCVEKNLTNIAVINALKDDFNIISVLTLRDPVDSYLSLLNNGWVHFEPATFNEYCNRVNQFLNAYPDASLFLYENFVSNPKENMKNICMKFQISYDDSFQSVFDCFNVSGDSGRKGSVIKKRERKLLSKEYLKEIESSDAYSVLISYLKKRIGLCSKRDNYIKV